MIKTMVLLLMAAGWSGICTASERILTVTLVDTIPAKKAVYQKPARENAGSQPKAIKAVPKAKNQSRPKAITVKTIKVKPVKVIKPKINGRGFGK